MWRLELMSINSQKKVIELLDKGYKLEEFTEYKRTIYKIIDSDGIETTVTKNVIQKLIENNIIKNNLDYPPFIKNKYDVDI